MSNYVALTRRKGSEDEWKEAVWVDNYFGPGRHGVRFRGTIHFIDGREFEWKEAE